MKWEIGSTSHSKAATSIPYVPLGATYHTKWLKLLTTAGRNTNSRHARQCCWQNVTKCNFLIRRAWFEMALQTINTSKDIDIFSTNLSFRSFVLGKFSMSFSSLWMWRSIAAKLPFRISADTVEKKKHTNISNNEIKQGASNWVWGWVTLYAVTYWVLHNVCAWPRKQACANVCVQWFINQSVITVCRVTVEATVFRSGLSSGDSKQ